MRTFQSLKNCTNCALYQNQLPLLDIPHKAEVMWVGLSAKKIDDPEKETPLSPQTATGKILLEVEERAIGKEFYKTNLVKCLPLDPNHRLRYPQNIEMSSCHPNLKAEFHWVNPKVVFLLGAQVAKFIALSQKKRWTRFNPEYQYQGYEYEGRTYLPIHHPSYISVYKKKEKEVYIQAILSQIQNLIS